ncbi:MAG: right-handed parallel beta-helix repeat-containing protein [Candidatus Micrarchaeia archaeon]
MNFMKNVILVFGLFFLIGLGFSGDCVAPNIDACCNIVSSEAYAVTVDINSSGSTDCININAGDVSLDLGGFTVSVNESSNPGRAIDVGTFTNITIFNGEVFGYRGISVDNSNATIYNLVARDSYEGIFIVTGGDVNISNVTVYNNTNGLETNGGSTATGIVYNSIFHNNSNSIYLIDASINFSNNIIENSTVGISTSGSQYVTFSNNSLFNNTKGFLCSYTCANNTFSNNTVFNSSNIGFDVSGIENVFSENTIHNNTYGIQLNTASLNNFSNNIVLDNNYGLDWQLVASNSNTFSNCQIQSNLLDINMDVSSSGNNFSNITLLTSTFDLAYTIAQTLTINSTPAIEDDTFLRNISSYINLTFSSTAFSLNLSYTDAAVSGLYEDGLRLYSYDGSNWAEVSGSSVDTTNNKVLIPGAFAGDSGNTFAPMGDLRQFVSCTNISLPSSYSIHQDLDAGEGICINITTENVSLDLNGFTIYNSSLEFTPAISLYSASNISVYNGSINGSYYGIFNYQSSSLTFENLSIYNSTYGVYHSESNSTSNSNITIYDSIYGFYLLNSNDTTILSSSIYNNTQGLFLENSNYSVLNLSFIYNNTLTNILLLNSDSNTFEDSFVNTSETDLNITNSNSNIFSNISFEQTAVFFDSYYGNLTLSSLNSPPDDKYHVQNISKYLNITNYSSAEINLTFYFDSSDIPAGYTYQYLWIYHYSDAWEKITSSRSPLQINSTITSFSPFGVFADESLILSCKNISEPGSYYLGSGFTEDDNNICINISSGNVSVDFSGSNVVITNTSHDSKAVYLFSDSGRLNNISLYNGSVTSDYCIYSLNIDNLTIQNMSLEGTAGTRYNHTGIYLENSTQLNFYNLTFDYFIYGINILNVSGGTVQSLSFARSADAEIYSNISSGIDFSYLQIENSLSDYGFFGLNQSNISISYSNITNLSQGYGIYIEGDYNITIFSNNISSNLYDGIYIYYTPFSNIYNNSIYYNSGYGIYATFSESSNISDNNIQESGDVDLMLISLTLSYLSPMTDIAFLCDYTVQNNTGSGDRNITFYNESVELENLVFSELILCNANSSNITNVTIIGSDTLKNNGFYVFGGNGVTVSNSNSSNNNDGFMFISSNNSRAHSNYAYYNNETAFVLFGSTNFSLYSNYVIGNNAEYGIDIEYGLSNYIYGNDVSNASFGITILSESGSLVENNTATNNEANFIIAYTTNNIFRNNTLYNYTGFIIYNSTNDTFVNNNVLSSTDSISFFALWTLDSTISNFSGNTLDSLAYGVYLLNTTLNFTGDNSVGDVTLAYELYLDNSTINTGEYAIVTDTISFGLNETSNISLKTVSLSAVGITTVTTLINATDGSEVVIPPHHSSQIPTSYGLNVTNITGSASFSPKIYFSAAPYETVLKGGIISSNGTAGNWTFYDPTSVASTYVYSYNITNFSYFAPFIYGYTNPTTPGQTTKSKINYLVTSICLDDGSREITIKTRSKEENPLSGVDITIFDTTKPNTKTMQTDENGTAIFTYSLNQLGTTYKVYISKEGNYLSYDFSIRLDTCPIEEPEPFICELNSDCDTGCCLSNACQQVIPTSECGYQLGCEWIEEECEKPECETDSDCVSNEYCSDGTCTLIEGECGYIQNHTWINYECCSDDECLDGYECKFNTCMEIEIEEPEPESPKPEEEPETLGTWVDKNKLLLLLLLIILVGIVAGYQYTKKRGEKKGYKGHNKK